MGEVYTLNKDTFDAFSSVHNKVCGGSFSLAALVDIAQKTNAVGIDR